MPGKDGFVEERATIQRVLNEYSPIFELRSVDALGNAGGFSGAALWRVVTPAGTFALRRWPSGNPTPEQLAEMHRVLERVVMAGINFVPVPVKTASGASFVVFEDRLWQLEPWLPGRADFWQRPTSDRLREAMQGLARFHLTAALAGGVGGFGVSEVLERRRLELKHLLGPWLDQVLVPSVPAGHWPELDALAVEFLSRLRRIRHWIVRLLDVKLPKVPLQPVIRDVWHDHVLFEGDRLSAIVDFGCLGIDSVAVDVARLAGSLIGEDRRRWHEAIEYYTAVRPLASNEKWLAVWARITETAGGGLVWLKRHYVRGITWDRRPGILTRVKHFTTRLEQLAQSKLVGRGPADLEHTLDVA